MLYLILLTFFVFFIFWLADILLTLKVTKKVGTAAEINPIMRKVLSIRGRFIWVFKLAEISVFLYLIYYVQSFSAWTSFHILLVYIFLYSVIVANNSRVFSKITGTDSSVLRISFVALSVLLILFIYLNYATFLGLTDVYNKFSEYRTEAGNALSECSGINITTDEHDSGLPSTFDIPIPLWEGFG